MRISDWSSDVCSSDLPRDVPRLPAGAHLHRPWVPGPRRDRRPEHASRPRGLRAALAGDLLRHEVGAGGRARAHAQRDRKSAVWGKSVSERVNIVGRGIIKNKNNNNTTETV